MQLCKHLAEGLTQAEGLLAGTNSLFYRQIEDRLGSRYTIRTENWSSPQISHFIREPKKTVIILQDSWFLLPIFEERKSFLALVKIVQDNVQKQAAGLRVGSDLIPAGFVTFVNIESAVWRLGREHLIYTDTHDLLTLPSMDSITKALATGQLRTAGVDTVTGELIALPVSTWRIERDGALQVIDALLGRVVLPEPSANPCRPIIALSDLARFVGACVKPDEPDEQPPGWALPTNAGSSSGLPSRDPTKAAHNQAARPSDENVNGFVLGHAAARAFDKISGDIRAKRDDAVREAAKWLPGSSAQAKDAFKRLPSEFRNPAPVSSKQRSSGKTFRLSACFTSSRLL